MICVVAFIVLFYYPIPNSTLEVILLHIRRGFIQRGGMINAETQAVYGLHIFGQLFLERPNISEVWNSDFIDGFVG